MFPVGITDTRRPKKERLLALISEDDSKAYGFENFPGPGVSMISDNFNGDDLVLLGSEIQNFITAFKTITADGTVLSFTIINNDLPNILNDNEGNVWDILGEAVSGPRTGERLLQPDQLIGYWFSLGAFYPSIEIY